MKPSIAFLTVYKLIILLRYPTKTAQTGTMKNVSTFLDFFTFLFLQILLILSYIHNRLTFLFIALLKSLIIFEVVEVVYFFRLKGINKKLTNEIRRIVILNKGFCFISHACVKILLYANDIFF